MTDRLKDGLEGTPAFGHFRREEWVDLQQLSSDFRFDIRYARNDNFLGEAVYPIAAAYLLKPVAQDLLAVQADLLPLGFSLLIFDAYRPWSVTRLFWDRSTPEMRKYLADPAQGSAHNRGCAVDLSLVDLKNNLPVQMPSDFDELNLRAHTDFQDAPLLARSLRDLLQAKMKAHRFSGIKNEWWHFNHELARSSPVINQPIDGFS